MRTHHIATAISVAMISLLPACERTDRGANAVPGTTAYREYRVGVTNAQAPSFDEQIIEKLAAARCIREESCGNVGGDRRYPGRDACADHMRSSIGDDLNAQQCPLGIDRYALNACLSAIDAEGCGDGVAILNRAARCRSDALCLK